MGWGQLLGGIAGLALAPVTGGASLAYAGLGSALGGAAEEALGGGATGAARDAAATTAAATNRAADLQYQMWKEQQALQEPWRQAGVNALGKLQTAADYTPFGMQQFQQDPGYGFRMSEGLKALERTAAHRGGLLSGATLKGVQRFGQDLASDEYTNAFNRYQTERQAKLGPLQSLAGVGQTAANTLGSQAGSYGTNIGNLYTQQGENAANALIAGQQARSSAYGTLGNALSKFSPSSSGVGQLPSVGAAPSGYDWGTMMYPYNR